MDIGRKENWNIYLVNLIGQILQFITESNSDLDLAKPWQFHTVDDSRKKGKSHHEPSFLVKVLEFSPKPSRYLGWSTKESCSMQNAA